MRQKTLQKRPTRLLPRPAYEYDLFQAIRVLEARVGQGTRLGTKGPASRERVRLRPSTSFVFPPSEVEQVEWILGDFNIPDRARLTTAFFGLLGTDTPLPVTYAEEILWAEDDEPHLRDFLDIFHHRLLSLLYRNWLRHRYEFAFEENGSDPLSRSLLASIGVDPEMSPEELGIVPVRLLRYLGLFLVPSRPVEGLETLLTEELQVEVKLIELAPRWVEVPLEHCFRMRSSARGTGTLGNDISIGTRMRDRSGHVRLRVGPIRYVRVREFRPGEPDYKRVAALVRLYSRRPLDVTLECVVPASEMPSLPLGGVAPSRLGRDSFMGRPKSETMVFKFEQKAEASHQGLQAEAGSL